MSQAVRVVWDDALISYDFGPGHPLAPIRVELTMALARGLGVLDAVEITGCAPATDEELALVHNRDYIDGVKGVSATGRPNLRWGLGTPDNPAFAGVHEASALVAGATLEAARAVWTGETEHALNVAGGLHHAMPFSASGFCVYNDPAIAIAWLLAQGATKVAYVDVDVHHGDGVQAAFYDDPRVLTISLHESPTTLFPGTGFPRETGAEGTAVNVALPAGCGDGGWLRAFHAVVPPLLREFAPDVLVTQQGCDSHALDPLAHLMLSLDGQRAAYAELHRLAHETAGGRWIATGGGGYELVQVVPRAWTHLIAEAAGSPVDPATHTPQDWRDLVKQRTGETAPLTMTDGRHPAYQDIARGYDPADAIDRAILACRNAVFPFHGLDPMP
ncbi:acetoin utilization protein AcuC [Planotetraspora kaengkrachanensis]|uniref:Acetoin utilization protein AcuC n=1 Tax=Planotetraspora kaengkrachanensis TaxID=575193 RepID=A0A8J3PQP1_9ACTN|nr:acetoin utilization protein AcuC [Planotetraspora kaengkrachanensis]GIG78302.1 acetoin utilization protein AcuC [Planotetraspora kaengkrachanensis]